MGRKQHVVDLSNEERRTLEWFISTGGHKVDLYSYWEIPPEQGTAFVY